MKTEQAVADTLTNRPAPIVIFVYRREIGRLVDGLKNDPLAAKSDLIIFSDGSRNGTDAEDIRKVRTHLKDINGFASVKIVESANNKGLAGSIIEGVTQVIKAYGKVIVLEDDLSVADDFLHYMNEALRFYEKEMKVWSVSGFGANLPCLEGYEKDVYLAPRVCSWGWASWQDRWETIDWQPAEFEQLKKDKNFRHRFNAAGNDLYGMLELQMMGKIDSWAIRWQYNQFKQERFTVYPKKSKVHIGGFADDKGTHNSGQMGKWNVEPVNGPVRLEALEADPSVLACFGGFYNLGTATKIGYRLKKFGGYALAKKLYRAFQKRGWL